VKGIKMVQQPQFSHLISFESLTLAFTKVLHNGGGAGGDGVTLMKFANDAPRRLLRLSQELKLGFYQLGALRRLNIPKKSGGTRTLAIPCIIDRVVQTALATALTPLLEEEFEEVSYGYRPNRSVKQAVARVAYLRRQGYKWVVDGDIKTFFDEVPHDKLCAKLQKHVEDQDIIALIAKILHSFGDEKGLAQGSPLSPLLSNLYLDSIDEAMEGKEVRLIRFADDFVLLTKTQHHAENALIKIAALLKEHGLELNLNKTKIVAFEEALKFLGHLFVGTLDRKTEEVEEVDVIAEVEKSSPPLAVGIAPLYVLEEGRRIEARHETFEVYEEARCLLALPVHLVGRIDVGAKVTLSQAAQELALAHEITVSFLDGYGQTIGIISAPMMHNGDVHLLQAKLALDEKARLRHAKIVVQGRIRNCHALLKRLNRRRKNEVVASFLDKLFDIRKICTISTSIHQLLGYEGQATALYWQGLNLCFLHGFSLNQRIRREGADPINLVLDWLSHLWHVAHRAQKGRSLPL
jgi:CRISP-associated protein Cas1